MMMVQHLDSCGDNVYIHRRRCSFLQHSSSMSSSLSPSTTISIRVSLGRFLATVRGREWRKGECCSPSWVVTVVVDFASGGGGNLYGAQTVCFQAWVGVLVLYYYYKHDVEPSALLQNCRCIVFLWCYYQMALFWSWMCWLLLLLLFGSLFFRHSMSLSCSEIWRYLLMFAIVSWLLVHTIYKMYMYIDRSNWGIVF